MGMADKVKCEVCGAMEHVLEPHLRKVHGMTSAEYREKYPDAPLLSELAKLKLAEIEAKSENTKVEYKIHEVFGIKINEAVKTVTGWAKPWTNTPKIDPDYVFNKVQLALVLATLEDQDEQCLLTGPTGSGKTSCIEQVCARLNLPLTKINGDGDMTRLDLIGKDVLRGNETHFQYGLIPHALKYGHVLLLDEHDCLDPSVKQALQGVMEPGGKLVITETGETIGKHEDFRLFATGNTNGQGDESGLYAGTQPQNYANTMRFTLFGIIDYPPKDVEYKIISNKSGITDDSVLENLLSYAESLRNLYKKEETRAVMSTRSLVNIAKKLVKFGNVSFAYNVAFINAQNTDDQRVCTELRQRIWGV